MRLLQKLMLFGLTLDLGVPNLHTLTCTLVGRLHLVSKCPRCPTICGRCSGILCAAETTIAIWPFGVKCAVGAMCGILAQLYCFCTRNLRGDLVAFDVRLLLWRQRGALVGEGCGQSPEIRRTWFVLGTAVVYVPGHAGTPGRRLGTTMPRSASSTAVMSYILYPHLHARDLSCISVSSHPVGPW